MKMEQTQLSYYWNLRWRNYLEMCIWFDLSGVFYQAEAIKEDVNLRLVFAYTQYSIKLFLGPKGVFKSVK